MGRTEKDTAALFKSGGSQAVRLPKKYRLEGERVHIRREGNAVILEPIEKRSWPDGFWEEFRKLPPLPDDFKRPAPLPEARHRDTVLEQMNELDDAS